MGPNKTQLNVLTLQMCSVDSVEQNFDQIKSLLKNQELSSLDLVCLPENSLYFRVKEGESIEGFSLDHWAFVELGEIARKYDFTFHLGSVPLIKENRLVNASVLIDPSGKPRVSYEKIHLFDIQLEGQKPVRESDVFTHGEGPSAFEVRNWKVGQSICYDIRFAELYSHYARIPVDLILIPAAFLVQTGLAHWELLVRARAVESQAFVIAAAQAGTHRGKEGGERHTFGHSLVVDPWGKVLQRGPAEGAVALLSSLHPGQIELVRKQLPMSAHRRLPKS